MLIAGAGNLGKHVLDQILIEKIINPNEIFFYDDNTDIKIVHSKFKVFNNVDDIPKSTNDKFNFIAAIGHPRLREKLSTKMKKYGGELKSLLSDKAIISPYCKIDKGCVVQPFAVISHETILEESCIIHSGSTISHQVIIKKYVSVGPNVSIVGGKKIGNTIIGENTFLGAGCVILPNVKIGKNVIIGAGVVVDKDIENNSEFL